MVAAVVVPTIYGRLRSARSDADIIEMRALQNAILLFYRDVGRYPRRLDYLNALPASNVVDACGNAISARNMARYEGDYLSRRIRMIDSTNGNTKYALSTGDSIETLITRTTIATATGGSQQVLQILLYGPELDIAQDIDLKVDGSNDASGGIIHFVGNPAPLEHIVKWTLPIGTGAC